MTRFTHNNAYVWMIVMIRNYVIERRNQFFVS